MFHLSNTFTQDEEKHKKMLVSIVNSYYANLVFSHRSDHGFAFPFLSVHYRQCLDLPSQISGNNLANDLSVKIEQR